MTDLTRSQAPSELRVYTVLVGIALVAGLGIAAVHELTRPRVAEQRLILLSRAVFDVLPAAVDYHALRERPDGSFEVLLESTDTGLFLGVDAAGDPVGIAITATGMGYQDRIALIYGLNPERRHLLGLRVLESRETPGLGARIVDDPRFLAAFEALELKFDDRGRVRTLQIAANARPGAGEIDGITGATVSVRAVARIVSSSLKRWLPAFDGAYPALREDTDG
ncbi:MAG: FMN-binding protein [Gammaproteobacteria bacterium]|nr:FMN-binding protein [Gammaproteobacteria bacterium]